MAFTNQELINKIIPMVLEDAEKKRMDAGYSGAMHDGGSQALKDQVRFYQYGLHGNIPPEWEQYKKLLDPEYVEYLRLKRKFG